MKSLLHKIDATPGKVAALLFLTGLLFWLFVLPFFQKAQLQIVIEMEQYDHVQVFWTSHPFTGSSSFSEKNSSVQRLRGGRSEVTFEIPGLKVLNFLRIDPSTRETSFVIHSIRITQPGFTPFVIDSKEDVSKFLSLKGVEFLDREGDGTAFQSLGKDPQIALQVDSDFSYLQYVQDQKFRYQVSLLSRIDLLGMDWSGFFFLGLDLLLLLSISATVLVSLRLNTKGAGELCVLLGITGISVVIFSVLLCGMVFLLSWSSLLLCHAAIWLFLHGIAAKWNVKNIFRLAGDSIRQSFGSIYCSLLSILFPVERKAVSYLNAILLAGIVFVLLYSLVPAALTLPLNFDSNDYRLSRVGYWLQQANIYQFNTNDIRQSIMPPNCDLAMLWITSFFKKGYPLVHVISFYGGLLVCFSIYAISRRLQFPRHFAFIAVLIWLGIPNSASQMLTSQTDLFTTGCLMAGLYCFYQAIRHGNYSYYLYAGIGIGLAVGAKSTVFLWGPGLVFLCLAIVAGSLKGMQWNVLGKGLVFLTMAAVLSGGFIYGQNYFHYKNFLGPTKVVASISDQRDPVVKKAGVRSKMSKMDFVTLRAKAYLWQIFEPNSNLAIIKTFTNAGFVSIEKDIYHTNKTLKSSFVSMFKAAASWLRASNRISEDYASFGVVPFVLLLLGGFIAVGKTLFFRDSRSIAVTVLFVSVALYGLFFCWVVGWTVHRYRYAVLVTPFIAVTGMYFLYQLTIFSNRFIKAAAIAVVSSVMIYQVAMAVNVAANSRAHGWFALRFPEKVYSYIFYWRDAKHLTDSLPENINRLGLVLAKGSWKSMFYRTGRDMNSFSIPVEGTIDVTYDFLTENRYDALITKKLSSISVEDHFNLIPSLINTYQALIPAESVEKRVSWIVPNGYWSDGWVKLRGEVRIGNWKSEFLSLDICNPAPVAETIILKSSVKESKIELQANSECQKIDIPVNDNDFISWRIKPGYHPWKDADSREVRSLGVVMKFPKPE